VWKEGRVGAMLSLQVTNVLNHMEPDTPTLTLTAPTTLAASRLRPTLLATWSLASAFTSNARSQERPGNRSFFSMCAEHVRQLEGASPFHNLREVKG
jgi:hypothetical protein